ncbi:MAG: Re/Si-specific NAD(P)(+) transhydrogenase subunit alpha [bacterium]|nr:Re/Si-specific NAD(P)(+) transhydrogenase subunit alpha [bacterium]
MIIGIVKENAPSENRVALIPQALQELKKEGMEAIVESGAGVPAGYEDRDYEAMGAQMVPDRASVFRKAEVIVSVAMAGANPQSAPGDLELLEKQHTVLSLLEPLFLPDETERLAATGATAFAMELIPRISRAQYMDVLSSMASIAGYKAVLLAADALPRLFPMMMTAAGTIPPAKVLVIGAGVAGLQAIATAKRLGAMVSGYDVRPSVKEQVESVGGKFVELDLETADAKEEGMYAKEQSEAQIQRQQELMAQVVAQSDAVITTAAVPGKKSPVIVTEAMIRAMTPGSVIVDLAAERGGNCELSQAGEVVEVHGIKIIAPLNLPATVSHQASKMFSKNVTNFLLNLVKGGAVKLDMNDEIIREALVCRDGQIVHPKLRQIKGLPPLEIAPVSERGEE